MCLTRSSRYVEIDGRRFKVDGCMADIIIDLNANGFKTLGCCCGHGRYSKTIIVREFTGIIYEALSHTIIPRTRRFYRTYKDGYYYIPEIDRSVN